MTDHAKKFESKPYSMHISGKHIEVTEPIQHYIEEKMGKIETISTHIIDIRVVLEVQKLNHKVDITMKFSHFRVNVHALTENMYTAIDKAFERLSRKLKKWKNKIQDHHAKGVSVTELEVNVLEHKREEDDALSQDIIDANNATLHDDYTLPKVLKKKSRPMKELTLEEAVMKMELSNDHFMIYRSEEDKYLKVIYRRRDGSYGIISPE